MTADGGKYMVEFPEIARRHLSRIENCGDHPDSGMLTAFVEGTLTKAHRKDIFDHLSGCSECNRVVAMIAPEQEVIPVVQPIAARRGWLAWGSLRWAGAAVATAMVVSAVWIGRIDQTPTRPAAPSAVVQPAPLVSRTAQVPLPATVVVEPSASSRSRSRQPAPEPRVLAKAAPAATPPAVAQFDPVIAAQSRTGVPGDVRGGSAFQTSVLSGGSPTPPLAAAKPPQAVKPDPGPALKDSAVPAAPTGPMWSVSDAGVLQRSNDGGHRWAAVAVPNRAPLRVLSVVDQDIWAGGDRGELYHSADAGRTWISVVPVWNGQTLTADIVRLAFTDLRHGWVVTKDGEIWMTSDAGASWSLKTGPK
jgi:hypothetical protein